ncbi:MAG: hypothetical protein EB127_19225 [Alphaproteobacteria bacterium]|nr:hypothetical protein [Alphaproteobacteria bacterium]
MLKAKSIQCKECLKSCLSGKRGLCSVCYAKYLKQRTKEKNQREKKKVQRVKEKERKSINKGKLLQLIQKLVRLCTPEYCCTCYQDFGNGRMKTGGHFVSARKATTAYLVTNIHQQCSHCNSDQSTAGKMYEHGKYVDKTHGQGVADWLWNISKIPYHFSRPDLIELRDKTVEYLNRHDTLTNIKDKYELLEEYRQWQESTNWFNEIKNLLP